MYYKEIGYDEKEADELRRHGFEQLYKYWKQFEIHTVERIVQEYQGYIIDFGAGHSVYEDNEYFDRAKKALKNEQFIILLLPSMDMRESIEILNARNDVKINEFLLNMNPTTNWINIQFIQKINNRKKPVRIS